MYDKKNYGYGYCQMLRRRIQIQTQTEKKDKMNHLKKRSMPMKNSLSWHTYKNMSQGNQICYYKLPSNKKIRRLVS